MRIALAKQTLTTISEATFGGQNFSTHKLPSKKIPDNMNFCLLVIFNRHTKCKGI